MSPDLDRRLREGRETLPEPDAATTERARERALTAIRRPGRRHRRTVALLAAVVVAALLGVGFAGASFLREPFVASQPAASRIVDRTFVCSQLPFGGVPEIEVRAHPGIREGRSSWKQLAWATVSSSRAALLENTSFAWITAGAPSKSTTVDTEVRRIRPPGTLSVNTTTCRHATSPVPLSSSGLSGGAASPFGDEFDCPTSQRFLFRMRAVLYSPGSLRSRRSFLRTSIPAREARFAVRTQAGKPLVYSEVLDSGKTSLFTAKSCVRE